MCYASGKKHEKKATWRSTTENGTWLLDVTCYRITRQRACKLYIVKPPHGPQGKVNKTMKHTAAQDSLTSGKRPFCLSTAFLISRPRAFPRGGGTAFPISRCLSRIVPENLKWSLKIQYLSQCSIHKEAPSQSNWTYYGRFQLPKALAPCILPHTEEPILLRMQHLVENNQIMSWKAFHSTYDHLALLSKRFWVCDGGLEDAIPWRTTIDATPVIVPGKESLTISPMLTYDMLTLTYDMLTLTCDMLTITYVCMICHR